MNKHVSNMIW